NRCPGGTNSSWRTQPCLYRARHSRTGKTLSQRVSARIPVLSLFRRQKMTTSQERYTTNLSKAQGIIPETYELLELWEPGMTSADLTSRVKEAGALGKPTHVRMEDVVTRGFARRYLIKDSKPALWLKRMLDRGAS